MPGRKAFRRRFSTSRWIVELLEGRWLLAGADPVEIDPDGLWGEASFVLQGNEWSQPGGNGTAVGITYGYSNGLNGALPGVTADEVRDSFEEGLQLWSAVAPLEFSYSSNGGNFGLTDGNYNANPDRARILFGHHNITDPPLQNVLAHAFYPPPNSQELAGDVHFDNSDTWDTFNNLGGFDLIEIGTHEIGHALGLAHEPTINAIMNPIYASRFSGPGTGFLLADDIGGIQSRYGAGFGYVLDDDQVLHLSGTAGGDTITLSITGGVISGTAVGFGSFTRATAGVTSIIINGRGGSDTINIDSGGISVVVNAGAGDDYIQMAGAGGDLTAIVAGVTVHGGGGVDEIVFWDSNRSASSPHTYEIDPDSVDRTNYSATFHDAVERLTLSASNFDDQIDIQGVSAGTEVRVSAAGGEDAVNIIEVDAGGVVIINPSAGDDQVQINADGLGFAAATLAAGDHHLASLWVGNGGGAITHADSATHILTASLTLEGTAKLDLADNVLIVDYATSSPISSVRSMLTGGYAGGTWIGDGIFSSVAATTSNRALGVAEATDSFIEFPAVFGGQDIDETAVLVRLTLPGDANLDQSVDIRDLYLLAANFGLADRRWSQGDFNFDDLTDVSDLTMLAQNWQGTFAAPAAPAPIAISRPPTRTPRRVILQVA